MLSSWEQDLFFGQWHWWSPYIYGPLCIKFWSVSHTPSKLNFILGHIDVSLLIGCGDLYMLVTASGFYKWGPVHTILNMALELLVFSLSYGSKGLQHYNTYIAHIDIVQIFVEKKCPRVIWWTSLRQMLTWFTICRLCSEDFGLMGLRYGSRNLSAGVTLTPFSCN